MLKTTITNQICLDGSDKKDSYIVYGAGSPVTLDPIRHPVGAYTARQCYANVKRVIERLAASFNSTTTRLVLDNCNHAAAVKRMFEEEYGFDAGNCLLHILNLLLVK